MVKNLPFKAGDMSLIPGVGRFPGEGDGNPFQEPGLGNPMMEEPGRLQSLGSQRLGYNLETKQ